MKVQINVRVSEALAKELRVEAAQMGLRIGRYVELLLSKRGELLR